MIVEILIKLHGLYKREQSWNMFGCNLDPGIDCHVQHLNGGIDIHSKVLWEEVESHDVALSAHDHHRHRMGVHHCGYLGILPNYLSFLLAILKKLTMIGYFHKHVVTFHFLCWNGSCHINVLDNENICGWLWHGSLVSVPINRVMFL